MIGCSRVQTHKPIGRSHGWSGPGRGRAGLRRARDIAPERELLHSSFLTVFGLRRLL
jgi:hypothetical protein